MDVRSRVIGLALAAGLLSSCATATYVSRAADPVVPEETILANCGSAVRTLEGGPDHHTAMCACVDAKTRQNVH